MIWCESCAKKRYSRKTAEKIATHVFNETGMVLRAYPCPMGLFHLTSQGFDWGKEIKNGKTYKGQKISKWGIGALNVKVKARKKT